MLFHSSNYSVIIVLSIYLLIPALALGFRLKFPILQRKHNFRYIGRLIDNHCLNSAISNSDIDSVVDVSNDATPGGSSGFSSPFLQDMAQRGYIYQCTNFQALDEMLQSGIKSAYIGFDATADSLHIGSLVQLMVLRLLQKHGIKPVILIGGGTTKVGDPTGRNTTRQMIPVENIDKNVVSLSKVFSKFVSIGPGPTDAVVVNSADWWNNMSHIDFLRDCYKHFTVQHLLGLVKQRMNREDSPLSLLEFSYLPLQAYDFMKLNELHGTVLQIGGSDQYNNICLGVSLARKAKQVTLFGLTTPLITNSKGSKMGKSESGAVWLNDDLLSPFEYWQYWRNCADSDVIRFLKLFTDIPLEKIQQYETLSGSDLNKVKEILANEATALLHGAEVLSSIHDTTKAVFNKKASTSISLTTLPHFYLAASDMHYIDNTNWGISALELCVKSGLAKNDFDALDFISRGAIRVNDVKVLSAAENINRSNLNDKGELVLSHGKKQHVVVTFPRDNVNN